jgi:hypothetical protein
MTTNIEYNCYKPMSIYQTPYKIIRGDPILPFTPNGLNEPPGFVSGWICSGFGKYFSLLKKSPE